MGLNNLVLLTLIVGFVVFATVHVTGNNIENELERGIRENNGTDNDTDCEDLHNGTTLLCNNGDGIQNIERRRVCNCPGGRDYRFQITCKDLSFCGEVCQWTTDCSTAKYGTQTYVSGIETLFFNKERYTIVLCCTAPNLVLGTCQQIQYYSSQYVIEGTGVIHQMVVNPTPQGKPFALVEVCDIDSSLGEQACADRVTTVDSALDSTFVGLAELLVAEVEGGNHVVEDGIIL